MTGEERLNDILTRFCVGVLLDLCEEDMAQAAAITDHEDEELADVA